MRRNEGRFLAVDDGTVDRDFEDVLAGREIVHQVEHELLKNGAEGPSAGAFADGLGGERAEGVLREGEPDIVHGKKLGVLLGERVLGVGEDHDELLLAQLVEHRDHRQAPDEFRDEPEGEKIFRLNLAGDR